jgi:hypothetical protein
MAPDPTQITTPADQQAPAPAQALTQPTQDAPALPAQPPMVMNPGAAPQQPAPPPPPKGVSPDNPHASNPAVQRAGLFHTIAQALAGGPRYQVQIDPTTGQTTRTEAPMSTKDIGMAIALEAIGGALKGFSVSNGPGAVGRAAAAGGEDAIQKQVQAKQQQEQQASADAARAYQTMEANMRMKNLAISTGKLDYESHLALVKASEQQLAHLADGESLAASNLSETDAKDLQKYPITDYYRLPDGVVPRTDLQTGKQVFTDPAGRVVDANDPGATPAWDNTYSVVHRDARVPVADENGPSDTIKGAVSWNLLPANWLKAAPNATMPGAALASLSHKTQLLEQTQNDIANNFTPAGQQPFDLKALVRQNPQLVSKAFDAYQAALQATPSGHNHGEAIQHLIQTNPDAAGLVLQAYGGRDALDAFDRKTAHTDRIADLRLNGIPDDKTAQQILSAPSGSFSPDVVQAAKNFQANQASQAGAKAGAEERAKLPGELELKRAEGSGGGSSDTVQQLGESIASGNGTLDTISDRKTRAAVEAYLTVHHPNLDRNSVTLTNDERKKKQLADSDLLNLGIIKDVITKRPDLIGALQGRISSGKWEVGSNDADLARLRVAADQYGLASIGIHSSRSYQNKEDAVHGITNNLKNGPQAILGAIDAAQQSARVFADAGKPKGMNGSAYIVTPKPQAPGQTIDVGTVQKYVAKYGNAQAARVAAQKDGWTLPGTQGSK